MASDWIKMRTDLYRDPKVCVIADILLSASGPLAKYISQNIQCEMAVTRNVMRNVTVGALVSVWGVLRHRGKRIDNDLHIKGCTLNVIDDLAEIPGFGDAMFQVGWLEHSDTGIVLPRFFDEFNVDPSEELKAGNAERQRRYRERHKAQSDVTNNVTVTSQSNAREEKRREEKKPIAQSFARFWSSYPKKVSKGQAEKAFAKLSPDEQLTAEILAAVERAKTQDRWLREDGKFIPYPATWLNAKGWLDELEQSNGVRVDA